MTNPQKGFLFVAVALGALVTGYLANPTREPIVGTPAREALPPGVMQMPLAALAGGQSSLAQWQGKVLVVNFWATWCAPCRKEIPEFIRMQNALGARGLQFVGVAIDEVDPVRQYAAQAGINYPVLVGEIDATELGKALGNQVGALPYTVVLDRSGKVVQTILGATTEARLIPVLEPLF